MNYSISKLNPKLVQNLLPIQIKFALKKKELSNTEWQKIIDTVPAHVYYKDVKGTVLSCNIAQASALGCSATDKVIGKDHSHFLNNEISEKHTYHDSEIALTKVSKIIEEETMIQGKEAWVLSHKAPMIENGKVVGIVGVSIDITKQKALEKELIKKLALEQVLDQNKRLLSNMSHEIRTPLHVIVNAAELVGNEDIQGEKRITVKNLLSLNSKRLLKYLDDILDLAKSAQHSEEYDFKVQDIVQTISYCMDQYSHILDVEYDETKSINVKYDDIKIKRVINNLLSNASQYGENKNISIKVARERGFVKVFVVNNGVIPDNELTKIFEPFYQSEKTRTDAGGTGLGLAICKEIIIAHKGNIWAESKDGKVSFIFKLKI
jgi:PAS domain S-box-containing protein